MFALACDGMLFFKTFGETINEFSDKETKAYPGSKNTAPANPEWFENTEKLLEIAQKTIALTPPPTPKKKKS